MSSSASGTRRRNRHMALDWLAQTRKGCFVLVKGLLCTRPGLCFFFFHPVGAAFPPCRGFVSVLFAFILSGSPPPFYHPASGFIGVPPGSQATGFEPVPFRVCANQSNAICDAIRCLSYLIQTKHLAWTASKSTYFSARTGTPMMRRGGDISAVFSFDEAHSDSDFAAGPSVSGYSVAAAGASFAFGSIEEGGPDDARHGLG